ncbi:penicillin-binding protein 1C [Alphaproteobacteria bacterium KMM 3653]|uniref:peptidoglycan glycosyltransferase n=1 Tax=Harenicola maris TaxID=2841044 RepID=A0AAP2CPU4_9RHOB|nr:penicillin-binding protein 1C [Harenicola maris]
MRPARWLIGAAVALGLAGAARDGFDDWVDATQMPPLLAETSVEVLGRDGTLLRAFTVADGRWRLGVEAGEVDAGYIAMLTGFEDKRFWDHAGVDPRAMARALWQAALNGRVISGGSTLTMQTARLLEDGTTGQWGGKLRQMRVALAMERRLSKAQILTLYLNRAPFGGNLEGVRAASFAYFGKEPRRLTPAQAALLVALPQSPEARRPDRAPGRAAAARRRVLHRAVAGGLLSADAAQAALLDPVPNSRAAFPALAPHLAERLMQAEPLTQRHVTTIDPGLQRQLEALARARAAAAGRQLSLAILVADHRSGEVLASVGSPDYTDLPRQGYVDMTRALRSPGSTLKPLVYGLAFDQGLAHPETLIDDRPQDFAGYAPLNFDGEFRGTLRVREALQLSLNLPVVALTQAIGPANLMTRLRHSGAEPKLPGGAPGLAIALGGVGLTLHDLTQLYAALANHGESRPLHVLPQQAQAGKTVLTPEAAWQVGHILSGLAPPPRASIGPMAYKTGTSYGHRDTWAVGYDGEHVIGVWMGRADGTPVPGAFGGDVAAPILFEAFDRLKPRREALPPPPPGVLLLSTAALPQPLQRFAPRDAAFTADPHAPKLAFPPDGAELEMQPTDSLVVKVRDGIPPFTWLANGRPLAVKARGRSAELPHPGPGFVTLSVIDAKGRSAQSRVRLR